MSTIKDVSQYTGLSIATISKYLNGGNVLEENRARIVAAVETLGYKVNHAARALKTNRTRTVGVLLPTLTTPFFAEICANIEHLLTAEGYSMFLCSYYEHPDEEIAKLHFLVEKSVDGIIMVPQSITADSLMGIEQVREKRTPVVLMDRSVAEFDRVLADNSSAVHDAVEELIINGHRRIGIIIGPPDITTAFERKIGYERAHADYSLPVDPELIRIGDYSIGSGYREMNALLNMKEPPTAVMGTNHEMTVGAITAAYERKLKIPDDISFIGYDEVQLTKVFNPPITIVLQPIEEIARHTTEILLKRMRGDYGAFPQVCRLKTKLLLHESVGRPL
ncbi:MAG: LacI family transcriptional regulator [Firmicutes bacterium]|nr:LacI family transcriptional regulator [Bacillota bacterium]